MANAPTIPPRGQAAPGIGFDPLIRSFLVTCSLFLALQYAIFCAYALPMGFFASYAPIFFPASLAIHAMLFGLLALFRHDFCLEPSGEPLARINLANVITLFRLSALPTVLAILHASKDYPLRKSLIFLVAIVFASDFLDGYVSRKGKQVTRAGKMLDASSDYALLFAVGTLFYYFHFIPIWFFAMLLLRLFGQAAMAALTLASGRKINPASTPFGKVAVAVTMGLFVAEITRLFLNLPQLAYRILEGGATVVLAVSLAEKIALTVAAMKTPKHAGNKPGRLHGIQGKNGDPTHETRPEANDSN